MPKKPEPFCIGNPARNAKYPWKTWFEKKQTFTLKRGRDFDCEPHSMAQQIRNTISRYNRNPKNKFILNASIKIAADTVTVLTTRKGRSKCR